MSYCERHSYCCTDSGTYSIRYASVASSALTRVTGTLLADVHLPDAQWQAFLWQIANIEINKLGGPPQYSKLYKRGSLPYLVYHTAVKVLKTTCC